MRAAANAAAPVWRNHRKRKGGQWVRPSDRDETRLPSVATAFENSFAPAGQIIYETAAGFTSLRVGFGKRLCLNQTSIQAEGFFPQWTSDFGCHIVVVNGWFYRHIFMMQLSCKIQWLNEYRH